jgi:uncharacterized membrane protein
LRIASKGAGLRAGASLFSLKKEAYNRACQGSITWFIQERRDALPLDAACHTPMDTTGNTNTVSTTPASPHAGHHWTGGLHLPEGLHHLRFPTFTHEHPAVKNVNDLADQQLTVGQKVADTVAANMGSWRFIIIQSCILVAWIIFNSIELLWRPFDPYPFILLNLALSFQAAFAAPFIMISQNRQAEKDRLTAQNDYMTDVKGEQEIAHILTHLDHQDTLIIKIIERLEAQHEEMLRRLTALDPAVAQQVMDQVSQATNNEKPGDKLP